MIFLLGMLFGASIGMIGVGLLCGANNSWLEEEIDRLLRCVWSLSEENDRLLDQIGPQKGIHDCEDAPGSDFGVGCLPE